MFSTSLGTEFKNLSIGTFNYIFQLFLFLTYAFSALFVNVAISVQAARISTKNPVCSSYHLRDELRVGGFHSLNFYRQLQPVVNDYSLRITCSFQKSVFYLGTYICLQTNDDVIVIYT
jgi:hypothetical protein